MSFVPIHPDRSPEPIKPQLTPTQEDTIAVIADFSPTIPPQLYPATPQAQTTTATVLAPESLSLRISQMPAYVITRDTTADVVAARLSPLVESLSIIPVAKDHRAIGREKDFVRDLASNHLRALRQGVAAGTYPFIVFEEDAYCTKWHSDSILSPPADVIKLDYNSVEPQENRDDPKSPPQFVQMTNDWYKCNYCYSTLAYIVCSEAAATLLMEDILKNPKLPVDHAAIISMGKLRFTIRTHPFFYHGPLSNEDAANTNRPIFDTLLSTATIIPYKDSPDRRDAFEWVRQFYSARTNEVIIAQCNEPVWNKSKAINRAVQSTSADILVISDADSIIGGGQLINAIAMSPSSMILPVGRVCYMNQQESKWMLGQRPNKPINGKWFPKNRKRIRANGLVWVVGRDAYDLAGGMDEGFWGWGPEDIAFLDRVKKAKIQIHRNNEVCFHFHHNSSCDDALLNFNMHYFSSHYGDMREIQNSIT